MPCLQIDVVQQYMHHAKDVALQAGDQPLAGKLRVRVRHRVSRNNLSLQSNLPEAEC